MSGEKYVLPSEVMNLKKEYTHCVNSELSTVENYQYCLKVSDMYLQSLPKDYPVYQQTVKTIKASMERMSVEFDYKQELAKSGNSLDYVVLYERAKFNESREIELLIQQEVVLGDANLEIQSASIPYGTFFTVFLCLLFIYIFNFFTSGKGKIFKLASKLEFLGQEDLAILLKKSANVPARRTLVDKGYIWTTKTIWLLKRKETEQVQLSVEESFMVKSMMANEEDVNKAFNLAIQMENTKNEEEKEKLLAEVDDILDNFYRKLGIVLVENIPFNEEEDE